MSDQDSTQPTTKQRRSRKTNTANQQNGKEAPVAQRPANHDKEAWKAYWEAQGQPWRTEPEIDAERQKYLAGRREINPDIEQGIYPFKDIKLNRADVEWLLATHENGRGPVDWSIESQRRRDGLDLRGAILTYVDLSHLPLACLCGGEYIKKYEWLSAKHTLSGVAGTRLDETDLSEAHLEGANLINAHLECSKLYRAHLEEADLRLAHLEKAILYAAHVEGTNFYRAHLEAANLNRVYFSASTKLREISLGNEQLGFIFLGAVHWDDVDLGVVNWTQIPCLGNEYRAHQRNKENGERKDRATRMLDYRSALRANRRLAVALQTQGLNEDAARFSYLAQVMQRRVFWYQGKFARYLFSLILDLLTGYGYKPIRSFITYAVIISVFAFLYFLLGAHLAWNEAIVISMTAFHGRGFFPEQFKPGDPQALVAAIEAFVGLLIEVTFIATLTQRLFGK